MKISEEKIKGPAFGCQCPRFNVVGIHPNWLKYLPKLSAQLSLCYHDSQQGQSKDGDASTKQTTKASWDRELELEAEAALPQILLRNTKWKERKEMGRNIGPGSYDIKDFLELSKLKPTSNRGMYDTLNKPRIKHKDSTTPGPGAYGDVGLQATAFKTASRPPAKCGFLSSVYGRTQPIVGGDIGPGAYDVSSEIEKMMKRAVGTRGPYDVFSGCRDESSLHSYQKKPWKAPYQPGQYEITQSFVDALKKKENYGKFTSAARTGMTPKDITPGPGQYSPKFLRKPEPVKRAPFNSSTVKKAGVEVVYPVTAFVHFYDIDKGYTIKGCGNTSAFKSKDRFMSGEREKMLRERMK